MKKLLIILTALALTAPIYAKKKSKTADADSVKIVQKDTTALQVKDSLTATTTKMVADTALNSSAVKCDSIVATTATATASASTSIQASASTSIQTSSNTNAFGSITAGNGNVFTVPNGKVWQIISVQRPENIQFRIESAGNIIEGNDIFLFGGNTYVVNIKISDSGYNYSGTITLYYKEFGK